MEDFYNLLKQDGEYTKDYDSFKKDFGSPESQRALYDAYKAEGRVTREFPEWQKKWFSGDKMVDVDALKKKEPTSPASGQPQGMVSGVTPTGESAVPVQPQAPVNLGTPQVGVDGRPKVSNLSPLDQKAEELFKSKSGKTFGEFLSMPTESAVMEYLNQRTGGKMKDIVSSATNQQLGEAAQKYKPVIDEINAIKTVNQSDAWKVAQAQKVLDKAITLGGGIDKPLDPNIQPELPEQIAKDAEKIRKMPTQQLVDNYVENALEGIKQDDYADYYNIKSSIQGKLPEIEKIRSKNIPEEAKYLQSVRLLTESAERGTVAAGELDNKMIGAERAVEMSNPTAYRQVLSERVNDKAAKYGITPERVRAVAIEQSIPDVFTGMDAMEAQLVAQKDAIKNAIKTNGRAPWMSDDDWRTYQADKKSELDALDEQIGVLKNRRLEEYQAKINNLDNQIAAGEGDTNALVQERDLLKKQMDGFMNPMKQMAEVMSKHKDEVEKSEGETPYEKLKNYYADLATEYNYLVKRSGEKGVTGVAGEMLGGASEATGRMNEIRSIMASIAPVVFFNEAPREGTKGFINRLGTSLVKGIMPDVLEPSMFDVNEALRPQEIANNFMSSLSNAGIDPTILDPQKVKAVTDQAAIRDNYLTPEFWGDLAGGSFAMATQIALGNKLMPLGSLEKLWSGTKFGKWFGQALDSGISYQKAGMVFGDNADELNFASGFFGGAAAGFIPSGTMRKQASDAVARTFGDKAKEAAMVMARGGLKRAAAGTGETFEEIGNTLGNIFQESDTGRSFMDAIHKQFPDTDSVVDFIIGSFVAGAIMSGGHAASYEGGGAAAQVHQAGVKAYNNATPEQRKMSDKIAKAFGVDMVQMSQNLRSAAESGAPVDASSPLTAKAPEGKQEPVTKKKSAYDFDGTLFDNKAGKLTPLGEEVKKRIEAGEDITIVTARESGDTAEIESALDIKGDKIQATGDEAKKGEVLDQLGIDRADYYDADKAKMDAIQSGVQPVSQKAVEPVDEDLLSADLFEGLDYESDLETQIAEVVKPKEVESAVQEPMEGKPDTGYASSPVVDLDPTITDVTQPIQEFKADKLTPAQRKAIEERAAKQEEKNKDNITRDEQIRTYNEQIENLNKSVDGFFRDRFKFYSASMDKELAFKKATKDANTYRQSELDKIPNVKTEYEEIDKKSTKDFNKIVSDLGFKKSDQKWGGTAMGEDFGYYIQTPEKDAAIFIKPNDVEVETEDGIESFNDGIRIELVTTKETARGKGKAKSLIKKVTDWADANNTKITLSVAPQDASTTEEGLKKLYGDFGFTFKGIEGTRFPASKAKKERVKKAQGKPAVERKVEDVAEIVSSPDVPAEVKEEAIKADDVKVQEQINEIVPEKPVDDNKQRQLDVINKTNPAPNEHNTWIRSIDDIKTAEEAFSAALSEGNMYPDWTKEDMRKSLESGEVIVYSSQEIKDGVFVTPSKMNAQDYAGGKGGKLYSQKVPINNVAWIDEGEGQYVKMQEAPVEQKPTAPESIIGKVVDFTFDGDDFTGSVLSESKDPVSGREKYLVEIQTDKGRVEKLYVTKGDIKAVKPAPTGNQRIKKSYDKMRDAWTNLYTLGAIYDPEEQAKKMKAALEATIDFGAELIKAGVTDFNEWSKRMGGFVGVLDKVSEAAKRRLYDASMKRASITHGKEVNEPTKGKEEQKVEPTAQLPKEAIKAPETPKKEVEKNAEPTEPKKEPKQKRGFALTVERYPGLQADAYEDILNSDRMTYESETWGGLMGEAKERLKSMGADEAYIEMVKPRNTDPVVNGMRMLSIDAYGNMADKAVANGDMEAAEFLHDRAAELMQVLAEDATLLGQATGIISQWRVMADHTETFVRTRVNRATKAALERKRNGITVNEIINKAEKDINSAVKAEADTIANMAMDKVPDVKQDAKRSSIDKKQKEALDKVKAAWKATGKQGGFNSGADLGKFLDLTAALAEYGYYTVAKGAYTFADWMKKVKDATGIDDDDLLKQVWESTEHNGKTLADWAKHHKTSKVADTVSAALESKPKSQSESAKAAAELRAKVKDAIASHLKDPDGRPLKDVLTEDLGLDEQSASKVVASVGSATKDRLGTYLGRRLNEAAPSSANSKAKGEKRTTTEILLDKITGEGKVTRKDIESTLGEKLNLPKEPTREQVKRIGDLARAMKKLPMGSKTEMHAMWELGKEMDKVLQEIGRSPNVVGRVLNGRTLSVFNSLVYAAMLNGLPTHLKNFLSVATPVMTLNLGSLFNAQKWANAVAVASKYKGTGMQRMAFFVSSPLYEWWARLATTGMAAKAGARAGAATAKTGMGLYRYDETHKKGGKAIENLVNSIPVLERVEFKGGNANFYNNIFGKWVGRALSGTDAMTSTFFEAQETRAMLLRSLLNQRQLTKEEFDKAYSEALKVSSEDWADAERQAQYEFDLFKQTTGKDMPPSIYKTRVDELYQSNLQDRFGFSRDKKQEVHEVAQDKIFALKRHGMVGQIANGLGHMMNSPTVLGFLTSLGLKPIVPFTNIVGNMGDAFLDTLPFYGFLRANGVSPTGLLKWGGAKYGKDFKSAQMGPRGSELYTQQMGRAWFGTLALITLMMVAGDDDDDFLSFSGPDDNDPAKAYKVKIYGRELFDYRMAPQLFMPIRVTQIYKDFEKNPATRDMSTVSKFGEAYIGAIWSIKDMSFLDGFADFIRTVGDSFRNIENDMQESPDKSGAIVDAIIPIMKAHLKYALKPLPSNQGIVQMAERIVSPEKESVITPRMKLWQYLGLQSLAADFKRRDMLGVPLSGYPGDDIFPFSEWAKNYPYPEQLELIEKLDIKTDAPRNQVRVFKAADGKFERRRMNEAEFDSYTKRAGEIFLELLKKYMASEEYKQDLQTKIEQTSGRKWLAKQIVEGYKGASRSKALKELFGEQTLTDSELKDLSLKREDLIVE